MGNIIDEIQKLIKTAENAEQTLTDYIKGSNDKELLTEESSAGKTLIDIALDEKFENLLCVVLEKFPELAKIQNDYDNTFLHYAADKGLSEVLLKALEVDNPKLGLAKIKNDDGNTFLHWAANRGMSDVLLKALEVDPRLAMVKNDYDQTFLHYAALKGMNMSKQESISEVLLKTLEMDPSFAIIQDKYGFTFLHYVARNGMSKVLLKALEVDNPELGLAKIVSKNGNTFLHIFAIYEESKEILEKISPELLIKNDGGLDPIDVYNREFDEKIEKPERTLSSVLNLRAKELIEKKETDMKSEQKPFLSYLVSRLKNLKDKDSGAQK